ncbi:hypothetical protein FJK98_32165 [Micromonospora sp. HM134]|uniref:hypothetical protein n=1 Tax=Micromonospora sp. HM134 TaxID=2583243 RepID=UPI0011987013|nr:hypothetical protein [Micromonospora sp. HM134]QDY11219.1 hypothetical protein FJK98_32165 [Micromonospora sp. HM134]
MTSLRDSPDRGEREQEPRRLPLRWAMIIAVAGGLALAAGSKGGLETAAIIFFTAAGGMHIMID